MVYTCGSVLTTTTSMLAMFYLASFVKSVTAVLSKHAADTWMDVWSILAWSFEAAWLGIHPSVDWNDQPFPPESRFHMSSGQQLCGGLRFVIWNLIGDLEFFANTMGLSHWQSHSLCWACNASRNSPALDFRINWNGRGWVLYDPVLFHMQTRHGHKFWHITGVTSWIACQDMLHCLDTNGVTAHLCGSVLHDRIYSSGRPPQQELARIWVRIQELHVESNAHDSKLVQLQLSMVCNPAKPHASYPSLHAKGAEIRHLVPILAKFVAEESDGSAKARQQRSALHCMAEFYRLCEHCPMFPSPPEADLALQLMETALASYAFLNREAGSRNRLLYNVVPKVHYAWHLAYNFRFMNPRHTWTYKCESWVGHVSKIAASCSNGVRLTRLTVPLSEKYMYFVLLRLTRQIFDE